MSTVTSATSVTDMTGCPAPLGHQHAGFEIMYAAAGDNAGGQDEVGASNVASTRMIWFIEKCRTLENEKLALMELLDEANNTIKAKDEKIVAYKRSHLELRNLAAELCSKLKRDAAKKDKAEAAVKDLTKKLAKMKSRAAKAEADLKRSQGNFSRHQVKLGHRLKEAEAKHERFDQMQVEYEERLRQKDAEAVEAQAAFEKQLQKRARRFEAQKNVEADLQAQIDRHKGTITQRDATIEEMTRKQQEALLVLGAKIEELEAEMVRRQAEMADSLSAARKITTQFQEKDQQVVELQTLLETVSTERDELHHVIREFESKDEEQSLALAAVRKELMKERSARKEMQRQRNLEHMATQDMQLKWRASFGEAEDAPVGGE